MAGPKPVLIFLAKAVPLLAAFLWLWGGDRAGWYHAILAGALDGSFPWFDPTGAVDGVRAAGRTVLIRLQTEGGPVLGNVNAADVTSNMTMLVALYLASFSPRHPRAGTRPFLILAGGSVLILFLVHAATVATVCLEGMIGEQMFMRERPFSPTELSLIPRYNVFYEELGMYMVPVVLWLPYVLLLVRDLLPTRR